MSSPALMDGQGAGGSTSEGKLEADKPFYIENFYTSQSWMLYPYLAKTRPTLYSKKNFPFRQLIASIPLFLVGLFAGQSPDELPSSVKRSLFSTPAAGSKSASIISGQF